MTNRPPRLAEPQETLDPIADHINALVKHFGSGEASIEAVLQAQRELGRSAVAAPPAGSPVVPQGAETFWFCHTCDVRVPDSRPELQAVAEHANLGHAVYAYPLKSAPPASAGEKALEKLVEALPKYQLHVSLHRMEPFVKPFDSDPNGTGAFVRLDELLATLREREP